MKAIDFKHGDSVIVKSFGGGTRQNVVWESNDRLVYVCSERQFSALEQGQDAPPPIGFPRRDVEAVRTT